MEVWKVVSDGIGNHLISSSYNIQKQNFNIIRKDVRLRLNKQIFNKHHEDKFLNTFDATELPWSEKEIKEEEKRQAKFDQDCKDVVIKARKQRRKQELRDISSIYGSKRKKLIDMSTTTKQLMFFLLINCSVVEIYSMIAIWRFGDLSALPALITAVITETISFSVYCIKSYLETKSEKSLEFENKKFDHEVSSSTETTDEETVDESSLPDDLADDSDEDLI